MSSFENVPGLHQLEAELSLIEQGVSPDEVAEYREKVDDQAQRTIEAVRRELKEWADE
jgi:hypothetical protein